WVLPKPSAPVQALAPPEFSSTASMRPSASTWRDHLTGAAATRFEVKTPAAAKSGPRLRTTTTSFLPVDFSPAGTPAAVKPAGAVTPRALADGWVLVCARLTVRLLA